MTIRRYPDWDSFAFPEPGGAEPGGAEPGGAGPVAFGADLRPASVLAAYRRGVLPLPAADEYLAAINEFRHGGQVGAGTIAIVGGERDGNPYQVAWWSPDPRPLVGADRVRVGRHVRRVLRRGDLVTSADTAFGPVARACRAGREPRWLTDPLLDALTALHDQGWAHSIEVWQGDELVGGALGIGLGAIISGDTLFGRRPGAGAIAVADMAARLAAAGGTHIDAQWDSPFLRALGAEPVRRARYLELLDSAGAAGPVALPRGRLPARRLLRDGPPDAA